MVEQQIRIKPFLECEQRWQFTRRVPGSLTLVAAGIVDVDRDVGGATRLDEL